MEILPQCAEAFNALRTLGLASLYAAETMEIIAVFVQALISRGFSGKVAVAALKSRLHRTTLGRFLQNGEWNCFILKKAIVTFVIAMAYSMALATGLPVAVALDDTAVEKERPRKSAKRPTEACGSHHSHLKKKTVCGVQLSSPPSAAAYIHGCWPLSCMSAPSRKRQKNKAAKKESQKGKAARSGL